MVTVQGVKKKKKKSSCYCAVGGVGGAADLKSSIQTSKLRAVYQTSDLLCKQILLLAFRKT